MSSPFVVCVLAAPLVVLLLGCGNGVSHGDEGRPAVGAHGATGGTTGGATELSGASLQQTCNDILRRAFAAAEDVRERHLGCATSAECAKDWSTVCGVGGCPRYVALPEKDVTLREEAEATRDLCERYGALACLEKAPPPVPSCVLTDPSCVGGKCALAR